MMNEFPKCYRHHGLIDLEEGLAAIRSTNTKLTKFGHTVGVSSLRLQTFAIHGTVCISCGIEGYIFSIDSNNKNLDKPNVHLNLWALDENNKWILMTHDHILARGLGGKNDISNVQPMCTICNNKKSIEETRICNERKKNG